MMNYIQIFPITAFYITQWIYRTVQHNIGELKHSYLHLVVISTYKTQRKPLKQQSMLNTFATNLLYHSEKLIS